MTALIAISMGLLLGVLRVALSTIYRPERDRMSVRGVVTRTVRNGMIYGAIIWVVVTASTAIFGR